jgi:hypothetical protein
MIKQFMILMKGVTITYFILLLSLLQIIRLYPDYANNSKLYRA